MDWKSVQSVLWKGNRARLNDDVGTILRRAKKMDLSKLKSLIFQVKERDETVTGIKLSNIVQVTHRRNGIILHDEKVHNTVVTAGLNALRALVGNATAFQANYIGLSTNVSAPSAGDTDLGATVFTSNGLQRASGSYAAGATGVFTMAKTFTAGADSLTTASAGLYYASGVPNNLFAGVAITSATLMTNDTLEVTWTVTFS